MWTQEFLGRATLFRGSKGRQKLTMFSGSNDELLRRVEALRISRAALNQHYSTPVRRSSSKDWADMNLTTVWEERETGVSNFGKGAVAHMAYKDKNV